MGSTGKVQTSRSGRLERATELLRQGQEERVRATARLQQSEQEEQRRREVEEAPYRAMRMTELIELRNSIEMRRAQTTDEDERKRLNHELITVMHVLSSGTYKK